MTVQELIDELLKVEDKSKEIEFLFHCTDNDTITEFYFDGITSNKATGECMLWIK